MISISLGETFTSDSNMVALVTAQEKEGVKVPTVEEIKEIISSVKSKKIEPYVDAVYKCSSSACKPTGTKVVKRSDNNKFGYTELTFANGVRMVLKPTDFKNDEIVLSAFSPGGTSLYPDSDIMSANLATAIVTQSGLGDL